jgi:hypothetical protein
VPESIPSQLTAPSPRFGRTPRLRRVLIAAYIGICCAIITITISGYTELYRPAFKSETITPWLASEEPLGGDFIAFYTGGVLMKEGRKLSDPLTSVYDFSHQEDFQRELLRIGQEGFPFLPFVYPPFVAELFMLFSPGSSNPEPRDLFAGYILWLTASLLLVFFAVELLLRAERTWLGKHRLLIYLGVLSFTPLTMDAFGGGQLPPLGIFIVSLVYYLLRKDAPLFAGLCATATLYKAPLFGFFLFGMMLTSQKRFSIGLIGGSVLLALSQFFLFGREGITHYLTFTLQYFNGQTEALGYAIPSHLGVGLYAPLRALTEYALPIVGIIGILWCLALRYRWGEKTTNSATSPHDLIFTSLIIISLSLSPQVNNYDISLLLTCILLWLKTWPNTTRIERLSLLPMLVILALHNVALVPQQLSLTIFPIFVTGMLMATRGKTERFSPSH